MPCITIKTYNAGKHVDTKSFAKEVSQLAEIEIKRINIIIDYYQDSDFYIRSNSKSPVVFISIAKKNGKEFIQRLAKIVSKLTEVYFSVPEDSVAVFCYPTSEGYLLVNGNFK